MPDEVSSRGCLAATRPRAAASGRRASRMLKERGGTSPPTQARAVGGRISRAAVGVAQGRSGEVLTGGATRREPPYSPSLEAAVRPALSTPCSRRRLPAERQLCSGSGHSRPQRELTVSATFRSSRRQRDRDADDRSQGSADVARRICVARWFPERQLNRYRGHWASKTNRMSAAHGAGLTHPTLSGTKKRREAVVRTESESGR